jgi:hypothetical protein
VEAGEGDEEGGTEPEPGPEPEPAADDADGWEAAGKRAMLRDLARPRAKRIL